MEKNFTSKSILLRKTRYKDNLYIIRFFTKKEGVLDARVSASMKGRIQPSLLEPMNILTINFKKTRYPDYVEVNEAAVDFSPSIVKNPSAYLILDVMREISLKTLHYAYPEERKFNLLEEYVRQTTVSDNHLLREIMLSFLRDWTSILGIMPAGKNTKEEKYFSISEGKFLSNLKPDGLSLNEPLSELMNNFIQSGVIPQNHEQVLTEIWVKYMQFHLNELKVLKSIEVIKDLKYSF